jgi:hypothetical protein
VTYDVYRGRSGERTDQAEPPAETGGDESTPSA